MTLLIKHGTIVTATDTTTADVGISGDKVSAIAAQLPVENASRVIDAHPAGLYRRPGPEPGHGGRPPKARPGV